LRQFEILMLDPSDAAELAMVSAFSDRLVPNDRCASAGRAVASTARALT
jgi:hypothetical protein